MSTLPKIISIEGNIGAGKTTILEHLQNRMKSNKNVVFIREPVDIWEGIKEVATGENILQKFYGNPHKYAFSFQVMAYATRLSMIRAAIRQNPDCHIIVCERSLDADKEIFAKMLHDDGMIEDIEYQIYQRFYAEYAREYSLSGIVYIDADAEVCHERVMRRLREGESGISLEYLQKCKAYHDAWLINHTGLLHLHTNSDVTYDETDSTDEGVQWINQIEECINSMLMKINQSENENVQLESNGMNRYNRIIWHYED